MKENKKMVEQNVTNLNLMNPFPGLRSFDYNEHHLFFGREKHIEQLLLKLEKHHFVAVVGTSGSGKSSLIKAGLLPAIHQGRLGNKSDEWIIVSMKPGNSPIVNLVDALTRKDVFIKNESAADLSYEQTLNLVSQSSLGLVQALRNSLNKKRRLLILVDQFEEVFRFSDEQQEKTSEDSVAFVNLIIESVRQLDIPIYVVLTLRSDFLGDCARFEGLPEAINDGHYLVPRLNKEQNKQAITGPINYASGKISPRLILKVLDDLGDNPDQLPVLQHALMRTWDKWVVSSKAGEPMDIEQYESIGGINHALSNHADEAYFELKSENQKGLIAQIFKSLTYKEGASRGIRRPTSVKNLMQISGATFEDILEVLHPFRKHGRTFILPAEGVNVNEETIIDISHESLMRGWVRLTEWVEEETNSVEIYKRLCDGAILFQQGLAALWRDPELQVALDWKLSNAPSAPWALQYNSHFNEAIEFLNKSEEERRIEVKSKKKRARTIRLSVIGFLIVVSILTIWALFQTEKAVEKTEIAELKTKEAINQKQLAESAKEMALKASKQALSAKSYAELQANIAGEQKKLAEEQKAKALEEANRANEEEKKALAQKTEALKQKSEALKQKQLAELNSIEAKNQKNQADSSRLQATRLRMISISQNIAFKSIQQKEDAQLQGLLAVQALKFARENKGNLVNNELYNAMYAAAQRLLPNFKSAIYQDKSGLLNIHISKSDVLVLTNNISIKKLNSDNFTLLNENKLPQFKSSLNTSYLSDNGKYIAICSEKNEAFVYNTSKPGNPEILIGHTGLIRTLKFNDDATLIASGGRDSSLIIWKNYKLQNKVKFNSRIKSIDFNNENTIVFVGCEDGNVHRYSITTTEKKLFSGAKNVRVQTIKYVDSSNELIVSYTNGVTQRLDNEGKVIYTFNETSSVDFIEIDEINNLLIFYTANKLIHIYQLSDLSQKPIEIKSTSNVLDLKVFNGASIFTSCADNTLRVYPLKTENFEKEIKGKLNRNFTTDEWNTFIGKDITFQKTIDIP